MQFGMKLKAETAEELEQVKTMAGIRARLRRFAFDDALTMHVFNVATLEGLSGEDTYTLLAYHALLAYERMFQDALDRMNASPSPPIFIVGTPETPPQDQTPQGEKV